MNLDSFTVDRGEVLWVPRHLLDNGKSGMHDLSELVDLGKEYEGWKGQNLVRTVTAIHSSY